MGEEFFGYRKLVAYQKAKEIVKRTYKLLGNLEQKRVDNVEYL